MPFCARCGAAATDAAAYCAACGARLADPPPTPERTSELPITDDVADAPTTVLRPSEAPVGEPGIASPAADGSKAVGDLRAALPAWVLTDWPLVVVSALGLIGSLALGGAVWGLVLGLSANGLRPSGLVGAVVGLFFAFAGLGGDTVVLAQAGAGGLVLGSGAFVPVIAGAFGFLGWLFLRFALRRTAGGVNAVALFVKFAVLVAVLITIVGAVAGVGDVDDGFTGDGFEVVSDVGSGEAGWWALVLLLGVGAGEVLVRGRAARLPRWVPSVGRLRPAIAGGAAALVVIAGLGAVTSVAAVAMGDSGRERLVGTFGAPLLLGNTGAAAHSVAVGASVGIGDDFDDRADDHISLFNWGLPPGDDAGGAPPWLLPLLLLAPAAAAVATWRTLQEHPERTGQAVTGAALLVVAGYAVTTWFVALAARLAVGGMAVSGDDGELLVRGGLAAPSVGPTLGLSLLWTLAGSGVAMWLWARAAGIDLLRAGSPPPTTTESGEPPDSV